MQLKFFINEHLHHCCNFHQVFVRTVTWSFSQISLQCLCQSIVNMHITFMTFIHNSIIHCIFSISQNVCFQITGVNHTYSYEYKSVPSRVSPSRKYIFSATEYSQTENTFFFLIPRWSILKTEKYISSLIFP